MKIQRYDVDIYNDNNLVKHDAGDYVKYEDHVQQIEKLQDTYQCEIVTFTADAAAVEDYIITHST